MLFSMSIELENALINPSSFEQDALLGVSNLLLGIRAANGTPVEGCLRSTMAMKIVDLLTELSHEHDIDAPTQEAAALALAALVRCPESIAGHTEQRSANIAWLKTTLATPPLESIDARTIADEDSFEIFMAAALLASARALAGEITDPKDTFPSGSDLHDAQSATFFLRHLRIRLHWHEQDFSGSFLLALSNADIARIRFILDSVEGRLPAIDPAAG